MTIPVTFTNHPNAPSFVDTPFTEDDKYLSPEAKLFMDRLSKTVLDINNQFRYGLVVPSFTTTEITTNLQPNASVGTIWFNTTLGKLQVLTATGIETVTSAP